MVPAVLMLPLLKNSSLDPWELSNYRPISNLSLGGKVLKASQPLIVNQVSQLQGFMDDEYADDMYSISV